MRILLALGVATTLTGCAVPPAIQIAGLIADGVSFASTGRSMTDHAVSMVTEEDCKLFRAVDGKAVCRPATDGMPSLAEVSAVEIDGRRITISYDYPSGDPSEPRRDQGDPVAAIPGIAMASLDPAANDGSVSGDESLGRQPAVLPSARGRAVGVEGRIPVPGAKPQPRVAAHAVMAAGAVAGRNGLALAMADRARDMKPRIGAPAADGATVVVVQSHSDRARAEQMARSYKALGAKVAKGRADGHTVYRVVVAVAPNDSAAAAKARLARAGFKDAWVAAL
ncbi:MAG: SPOR domain-containing protein [Alphaproteobacteria bacterium]